MVKIKKPLIQDGNVKIGFHEQIIEVDIKDVIPTKPVTPAMRRSRKYQQILSSIKEVGIIEPPVVMKESNASNLYVVLDGHLRIEALRDIDQSNVTCLVSKDNEAFTYNKHINRLSTIQEHKMIVRAIANGVSEQKIAQALSIDVAAIIKRKGLLNGICAEAADLLKDKMVSVSVFSILRKMVSVRQVEAATLMNDANVYTIPYAKVILASTPQDQLIDPAKPKKVRGLSLEQMDRMQNEMANLEREYKLAEETYSADILNFTLTKGYVTKLVENPNIASYLNKYHVDIFEQFQNITDMRSLTDQVEKGHYD